MNKTTKVILWVVVISVIWSMSTFSPFTDQSKYNKIKSNKNCYYIAEEDCSAAGCRNLGNYECNK